MKAYLIKNGTLITMDPKRRVLPGGAILVEGQRIKKVLNREEADSFSSAKPGAEIIDARGKLVLPGFVNAHGHAAMTLFRSYADDLPLMEWLEKRIWPLEESLEPEDVYWGTLLSILEMLKSGTTTFADMYFFMDEVARAVEESGIRGVLCRGMVGTGDNPGKRLKESEEFCRQWHGQGDGRITTTLGPHAPYTCPPAFLEEVLGLQKKLDVPLQIHLAETEWENSYCRETYSMSPVELVDSLNLFSAPTLAAHCVHVSPGDIEILAAQKVRVAHNPGSNLKLASGIAPLPRMLEAGVVVGLGTDGASSNNNLDMLEEIRLAALIHKGVSKDSRAVPASTALELATCGGAAAVFLEDTGSLEEGKLADLVIFKYQGVPHLTPNHNPVADIVYAAGPRDVDLVMVNGAVLLAKEQFSRLDEERILFETKKRTAALLSRAAGKAKA